MNEEYNSILKDKDADKPKIVKISEENAKEKNYALIFIFVALIVAVICYIVYYNIVLSGKNILINNLNTIYSKYSIIYDNLGINLNNLNSNYNLDGKLTITNNNDKKEFNYNINNIDKKFLLSLTNDKETLNYYTVKGNNYINYNKISDYYIVSNEKTFNDYIELYNNIYDNIDNYFSNKKNYKKTLFFKNQNPRIRVDIQLNNNDINNIINNSKIKLKDDYKINITLINSALSNSIIETKIVINNRTKKRRDVFTYNNGILYHTNNKGVDSRYEITKEDKDFTLNIYSKDTLYSVLSGKVDDNSYKYLYQVIDKKYNISLVKTTNNNTYNYILNIINNDTKKENISINIDGTYHINPQNKKFTLNTINKSTLTEDKLDIYNNILDNILGFNIKEVLT